MTITLPAPARAPERPGPRQRLSRLEADRRLRVAELRDAILDGTYSVPAADVADAIIASATRS